MNSTGKKRKRAAAEPVASATAQKTPLSTEQLRMPAGYKNDGTIATLAEVISPQVATLDLAQLPAEQRRDVVVKRLEQLPSLDIVMIGAGHIDKERAIAEVKADTEIGHTIMEIEQRSINYLLNKAKQA